MLQLLVTTVLLVLSCKGIDIDLAVQLPTLCLDGLRSGTDAYFITATIGPNYTNFFASGWINTVTVEVFSSPSQWETICPINIDPASCDPLSTDVCHCENFDKTTDSAHIVVRSTSQQRHSQKIIRGEWQNINGTRLYSTKNVTLPLIYDVYPATLKLKVNGALAVEKNGSCGSSFTANAYNTIELCCSSTTPCYPKITIDGNVTQNHSSCVTFRGYYKIGTAVNVTKSYSVCTLNDTIPYSTCMIEADVVTTTTAATINSSDVTDVVTTTTAATINSSDVTDVVTTTTAATTNSSDVTVVPPKVVPLGLILGLVFGFVIAICIIAAIIYTFWYKKHRKPHNIIRETHPKQHLDPLCTDGSTPNATGNGGRINPKDFDEKGKKGDDTQPVEQKKVTSPRPTKTEKGHNGNNSHDGKSADPQSETNKQENKIAEKVGSPKRLS